MFMTYSLLIHGAGNAKGARSFQGKGRQEDAVSLILKKGSRVAQLVNWLREEKDEDPLIIFDECHKAKNLLPKDGAPTQTAIVVCALQVCHRIYTQVLSSLLLLGLVQKPFLFCFTLIPALPFSLGFRVYGFKV